MCCRVQEAQLQGVLLNAHVLRLQRLLLTFVDWLPSHVGRTTIHVTHSAVYSSLHQEEAGVGQFRVWSG